MTYGAPHHLSPTGRCVAHRRTRAGDAADAARAGRAPGWACPASARLRRRLQPRRRVESRDEAQQVAGGDGEREVPEELSELNRELAGVERRVERRIDPGGIAFGVTLAMLVLMVTLVLPWTGQRARLGDPGGQPARSASLPRLFTFTSLGFGLVVGSLALATRWWALAWLTAVGCGISVVNGLWAIWSRQTGVLTGGTGPGSAWCSPWSRWSCSTACWARIAGRRG